MKYALIFGFLSGLVIIGYLVMLVALTFIFVGVKLRESAVPDSDDVHGNLSGGISGFARVGVAATKPESSPRNTLRGRNLAPD